MSDKVEMRYVALTENDAREAGVLHLWQMTPAEEDKDRITDETIVALIRQRTSLYRALRRLSHLTYRLASEEEVSDRDEILEEADKVLQGEDPYTLNSDFNMGERVKVPSFDEYGKITKIRSAGAWVLLDNSAEQWFILYKEMEPI